MFIFFVQLPQPNFLLFSQYASSGFSWHKFNVEFLWNTEKKSVVLVFIKLCYTVDAWKRFSYNFDMFETK